MFRMSQEDPVTQVYKLKKVNEIRNNRRKGNE